MDFIGTFALDPLGFVRAAFPWGEPGPLEDYAGPDKWQEKFLEQLGAEVRRNAFNGRDPVAPVRRAVSSGHGIGKSTMAAWLVCWIMSTRPHAQGTVTANTHVQLSTKTWAAVKKWVGLALTKHWFEINDARMYHKEHKATWFCTPQSCREENSEAFAGQHAASSTSFYIFDEDSAISDAIHEVAEGGLTDGEPMCFRFGNCTRSVGSFHECVFGRERSRWSATVVDSRTSSLTNKNQIQEWLEVYGEDSDFFRVRVAGLPPRASEAQFIDHQRILDAQRRPVQVIGDEPLVCGVDLAWGGEDENVIRFRRGLDARTIPPIKIRGELTREPAVLVNRLADVLDRDHQGLHVHTMFLDSAGIAGPVAMRLRELGHNNVQEVNFGAHSPDTKCRFMRDAIWQRMKDWLLKGSIDKDSDLEVDLLGPCLRPDSRQRIWLEAKEDMKKRGLDSPDDADALALTFAMPVKAPKKQAVAKHRTKVYAWA